MAVWNSSELSYTAQARHWDWQSLVVCSSLEDREKGLSVFVRSKRRNSALPVSSDGTDTFGLSSIELGIRSHWTYDAGEF